MGGTLSAEQKESVGQLQVEITRLLAEREVLRAVQRQGEDGRVIAKDRRGAVALVNVEVDHCNAKEVAMPPVPLGLHQPRGHRRVVEHAIAAAAIGVGVMRTAGEVGGHTLSQRRARCTDRRPDRAPRPLGHAWRPWKPDLALLRGIQQPFGHRSDVSRGVRQCQLALGCRRRLAHHQPARVRGQPIAQALVLGHRKAMPCRQRQNEVVGIEGLHGAGPLCRGRWRGACQACGAAFLGHHP